MPWSDFSKSCLALSSEPFALRNLRLPMGTVTGCELPSAGEGLLAADLAVAEGKIAWAGPPGERSDLPPGPDMERAMAWPSPLDSHTHLDKGQVWARSPNPDGSFSSASAAAGADAAYQNRRDVEQRVAFQLAAAYAHGTSAIRSHVDADRQTFDRTFEVLGGLAQSWQDRLTLQLCPFFGPEEPEDWIDHLAAKAATQRPGILSGFLYTTPGLDAFLERMIRLADRHTLALDFHADENLDPDSHCLRAVAQAVLRNGFEGRVLVGHCCALSVQPAKVLDETLDLVAEAGIGIVSLPLTNAYLMDRRAGDSPRYRGTAPVKEMRKRGIPVALASDNVRDPFYAYGDLDLPEVFRDALRFMQLDHPVGDWAAAVTSTAADLMGLPDRGRIKEDAAADLVLFPARTWSEFAARPASERIVLRAGRPIDTRPPDFRELDDLKGTQI